MSVTRRAVLALPALAPMAHAQAGWAPTRPVQLIVGFAPGGGSDVIARVLAEAAAPLYPVPLVVVNRPGAGGALAAEQTARMPPDGLALFLAGGSETTSVPAHREVPYDPRTSFSAIIRVTRHAQFICAQGRGGRFATLADAMEAARRDPGGISYASSGVGTLPHSVFLVLERTAGRQFLHVPYTGTGPSIQAVVSGQIGLVVLAANEMGGLVQSGELKPLAVASAVREEAFPDVPTLRELGYNVVFDNMKGWVGPAGLSPEIIAYHHDRMRQALRTPAWLRYLERAGEPDGYANGVDFQTAINASVEAIRAALRR